MDRAKLLLGGASVLCIVGLSFWQGSGGAGTWPAIVVAGQTFRVSGVAPGRYVWSLENGSAAAGPGVVRQQALVFERNDLVSLVVEDGLSSGAEVVADQPIARVKSELLDVQLRSLSAQRELLVARRQLLEAGARKEEIAAAQRALDVARAIAEGAKPEVERLTSLVAAGAAPAALLEDAQIVERIHRLESALAEAQLAQTRAAARPEELSAIDAELASVDASIQSTNAVLSQGEVRSPIAGQLALGQTLGTDGVETILRVQATDEIFVRAPVPERMRGALKVGAPIAFTTADARDRRWSGAIVEVAAEAVPLNGRQVIWVSASVPNTDRLLVPGLTGEARLVDGAGG